MKLISIFAAVAALSFAPAFAATLNVTDFSKSAYDTAQSGYGLSVSEGFETFGEGNVANGWSGSTVGSFATIGGTGSGGTVNGSVASGNFAGNDGSMLALRDGHVFGRKSTTSALSGNAADNMFLDSNDTYGIRWDVEIGSAFDRVLLTLTDAADVGATMMIEVGGVTQSLAGLGNGVTKMVEIIFDAPVTTAAILFRSTNGSGTALRNDGFSIDDLTVGSSLGSETLSAVPLPAGAWLLLSGFGALALMRRRRALP